jgi:PAS domain-containing protein
LVLDQESGLVVEANPAACNLFGYSGAEWNGVTAESLRAPATSGWSLPVGTMMRRKDGSLFPADVRQNAFEVSRRKLEVAIVRDISARVAEQEQLARSYSELQQAQVKLLQAQKLAAVGEVAAGVAHEINNPAAFVMMNSR